MVNLNRNNRAAKSTRSAQNINIYTEGTLTEPDYLNKWLNNFCQKYGLKIPEIKQRIAFPGMDYTDPLNIVQTIIDDIKDKESSTEEHDINFAVFDEDEFYKENKDNIIEAFRLAKSHNIDICFSNRSFEVWAILHFEYTSADMSKDDLYNRVKYHMPNYNHRKKVFDTIKMFKGDNEKTAVNRAISMRQEQAKNNNKDNPIEFIQNYEFPRSWTNADYLITKLKKFISSNFMTIPERNEIDSYVEDYNSRQSMYQV